MRLSQGCILMHSRVSGHAIKSQLTVLMWEWSVRIVARVQCNHLLGCVDGLWGEGEMASSVVYSPQYKITTLHTQIQLYLSGP